MGRKNHFKAFSERLEVSFGKKYGLIYTVLLCGFSMFIYMMEEVWQRVGRAEMFGMHQ